MRPTCQFSVAGGNAHTVPLHRLEALQALVTELGADHYPHFLRLGGTSRVRMQPVTARTLLAEVESFRSRLDASEVPCLRFWGPGESELGITYARTDGKFLAETDRTRLTVTDAGIRLVIRQFPPPVGFRSAPDLPAGEYECYFDSLSTEGTVWSGRRAAAMSGSGSPVALNHVPLPPVTRWDYSRVAGAPDIARVEHFLVPAPAAFKDIVHALDTACTDSLRLKHPLQIRTDR